MSKLTPLLLLLLYQANINLCQTINSGCLLDVGYTLQQASQKKAEWTLNMIDSTTKFPDGLLYGNLDSMGHWDECLGVDSGTGFTGKFCRVGLTFQNPTPKIFNHSTLMRLERAKMVKTAPEGGLFSLRASLCLPSTCNATDFELIAARLVPVFDPATQLSVAVNPSECFTLETAVPELNAGTIAAIVVFSLLVALVIFCTLLEFFNKGGAIVKALSARTTYTQLVSVKEGAFDCVNGIKVLSMLWIMLGHRYELGVLSTPTSNILAVFDLTQKPLYMALGNAFLSVDTFFLIGGFLLAYGFFRDMKRGSTFDAVKFYVYRYIRLTVPMLVMVVFYLTILRYMGAGPVWQQLIGTRFVLSCETDWWAAIFYVNNYYGLMQCVEQTWYTSVDMQMAWLSPLLLLPLHYSPKAGKQLAAIIVLISCFIPFTLTYLNNFPWSVNFVNGSNFDVFAYTAQVYLATHSRASPYLVGIILGYVMANVQKKVYFWNWKTVALGWIFSTAVCATIVFSLSISYQFDYEYEPVGAAFYGGFHRLGWAIGLSWIIFACTKGMGGPVNAILSWRLFSILSPLIYGVYLVHFMVIGVQVGAKKVPDYASHYDIIHNFFGDIPLSFAGACALYFVVEAPLMVFLRQIFKKSKPAATPKKSEVTAKEL